MKPLDSFAIMYSKSKFQNNRDELINTIYLLILITILYKFSLKKDKKFLNSHLMHD